MTLAISLTPVLDDPENDILHITSSLRIKCRKRFLQEKEFAEKVGLGAEFDRAIQIAHEWAQNGQSVEIYSDFAPHSFGFAILSNNGSCILAGGLIYQGPELPANGSAPSFSVSMDSTRRGWFYHS